jgi:catechol 2,3-dioxygenase-like lactoylglutathione lyase family enzyme
MARITFDHIHLRSPDPEATATWFERMLGAECARSVVAGKPRIDMTLGGQRCIITEADGKAGAPPDAPYMGLEHFGLAVVGIDAVAAELKAKGVRFTLDPTTIRPGVRIAFLRAPENIAIELLERTPA